MRAAVIAVVLGSGLITGVEAQEIRGRIVDSENGAPVALVGVLVLDRDRNRLTSAASDTAGFYVVEAPGSGEYVLFVQRLGYFENETPLFAVETGGVYAVDIEMRPEPFRLDPIEVVVRNEELIRYLTLEFGMNPNQFSGFRAIQGAQLEEAKVRAVDNTQFLRFLYIPVSHGFDVCVGSFGMDLPERGVGDAGGERQCGQLFLNGIQCRNEHIEEIPKETVAVVVTLPGQVRLFTREFDWTFNPAGYAGSC